MLILVALTISFLLSGSTASQDSQITYPDCTAKEVDWAYNSISQSPCQVAAYMQSTCSGAAFDVGSLPSGYVYTGPDGSDNNDTCKCNTVTYSLLSACAACQGEGWVRWAQWASNCETILPPSIFPNPVPSGIRVPLWALLDVTLENNWNPNNSKTVGGSPEIGPGLLIAGGAPNPSASSTITSSTGSSVSATTSSGLPSTASSRPRLTPQNTLSDASRAKKAAILGGVIGGIAMLVISIVVLVVYYMRRRRSNASSTAREIERIVSFDGSLAPSPMPPSPIISTRFYNPSDPTTFPQPRDTPYTPEVSARAIFGSHQRNANTLRLQISQEPDYYALPTASVPSFRTFS